MRSAYASFTLVPFSLTEKHSFLSAITVSSVSEQVFSFLLQPSKRNLCCSWGTIHIKQNKIISFHHYRLKFCNSYLFWNDITLQYTTNKWVSNSLAFSAGMIPDLLFILLLLVSIYFFQFFAIDGFFPSQLIMISTYISALNCFQSYSASFDKTATAPTVDFINRFKAHSEFNLWEQIHLAC